MGELSANLLAALQKRSGPRVFWLMRLHWWNGTELVSDVGISSRSEGQYKPKVKAWGHLSQRAVDPTSAVQDVTFSATLTDGDRSIANREARAEPLFQTACEWFLAGGDDGLPSQSDWYPVFAGFLDSIRSPGRGLRELAFRGLNVFSQPARSHVVDTITFPRADVNAIGQPIPRIWGRHQGATLKPASNKSDAKGACPTLLVDTKLHWYLVAEDWVEVTCVYKGPTPQSYGVGFTVQHPIIGASLYTVIVFTGAQSLAITCDVRGYDVNGDGTGDLIERPLDLADDVVKRLISPTGASLVDTTNIMPPGKMQAYGGFYYAQATPQTGVQIIQAIARSFSMWPILKGNGKVGFGSEVSWDFDRTLTENGTDLTAATWLRYQKHELQQGSLDKADHGGAGLSQEASGQDMFSRQEITYARKATGGDAPVLIVGDAMARAGAAAVDTQDFPALDVLLESLPDAVPGLQSWIEPGSLGAIEDTEQLNGTKTVYEKLCDLSGKGRNWIPFTGGSRFPVMKRGAHLSTDLSGLLLDPAGSEIGLQVPCYLTGPNASLILATRSCTFFLVFIINSVTFGGADGDLGNDCVFSTTADKCDVSLSSATGNVTLRVGANHSVFPYITDAPIVVCCHFAGGKNYIGVNEVRLGLMGSHVGGIPGVPATACWIGGNANGNDAFASITFLGAAFWNVALNEAQRGQVLEYFSGRYRRWPTKTVGRAAASLRELSRRGLRNKITIEAPLELLDVPVLGQVNVQDPDVPGSSGARPWQRRPYLIAERTVNPSADSLTLGLLDSAEQAVSLWISCRADSKVNADRDRYPGLAVFPAAEIEPTFADPSSAILTLLESPWSEQFVLPARPGRLPLVGPIVIPTGGISSPTAAPITLPGGLYLQSPRFNAQTRSSFSNASPFLGITRVGGGITSDTADLLFDSSVTPRSAKVTVVGGLDQTMLFPAATAGGAVPWYFSLDWKADSGHAMKLRINDVGGGNDFDPATGLFSATAPFYFSAEAYQGHAASRKRGRFVTRLPAVASIQVKTLLEGSLGNGTTAHVYHVNAAPVGDASAPFQAGFGSRIVNDASTQVAQANFLSIYNGFDTLTTRQRWPIFRGTALALIVLAWNAADIVSDHPIFDVPYDDTVGVNYFRLILEYNGGSPQLAFRINDGTGEVVAAVSLTGFVIGDLVRATARWTSAAGELGLPAFTASVFIQKIGAYDQAGALQVSPGALAKGNDVVYQRPGAQATRINIGSMLAPTDADVKSLDSILLDFLVVPRPMPDDEIGGRA